MILILIKLSNKKKILLIKLSNFNLLWINTIKLKLVYKKEKNFIKIKFNNKMVLLIQ